MWKACVEGAWGGTVPCSPSTVLGSSSVSDEAAGSRRVLRRGSACAPDGRGGAPLRVCSLPGRRRRDATGQGLRPEHSTGPRAGHRATWPCSSCSRCKELEPQVWKWPWASLSPGPTGLLRGTQVRILCTGLVRERQEGGPAGGGGRPARPALLGPLA